MAGHILFKSVISIILVSPFLPVDQAQAKFASANQLQAQVCVECSVAKPTPAIETDSFKDLVAFLNHKEDETSSKIAYSAPFAAIWGDDNREMVSRSIFPFTAMGKIVSMTAKRKGEHCTATLVNRCLVLTASHCMDFDASGNPEAMEFRPNFDSQNTYRSTALYYDPRINRTNHNNQNWAERGRDWLIVRLNGTPGDRWGWLGVKSGWMSDDPDRKMEMKSLGQKVHVAGYSQDLHGGDLSVDAGGGSAKLTRFSDGVNHSDYLLSHESDAKPGASGGPVLTSLDMNAKIIGIHSMSSNGQFEHGSKKGGSFATVPDAFYKTLQEQIAIPCD